MIETLEQVQQQVYVKGLEMKLQHRHQQCVRTAVTTFLPTLPRSPW